jgi:glutathione S-transferase
MILYGLSYSAYSAKVRIALRLKGCAFEEVPPPDGYRSEAYRRLVGTGTVPALDTGEAVLVDSNAIIEHLDETHPTPPLLPADPVARARARAAAGYHDTRVEPVIRPLFPLFMAPALDRVAFAAASALLEERLARLEETLPATRFIAGDRLSVGDLGYCWTLPMCLRLLEEAGVHLALSDRTLAWQAELAAIPEVQKTVAEAATGLEGWITDKRQASGAAR